MSEKSNVLTFPVHTELHGATTAAGRITGLQHASRLLSQIRATDISETGVIVSLDFTGVELATASYLKSVVLGLTVSGRLHAGIVEPVDLRAVEAAAFQPLNVFPVIVGANDEIQQELDELFSGRGLPFVLGMGPVKDRFQEARVMGFLDATAQKTLRASTGFDEITAYALHERFPKDAVSATAWNNRLADLFKLRIMQRRREGKFWKYQPVADTLTYG